MQVLNLKLCIRQVDFGQVQDLVHLLDTFLENVVKRSLRIAI